MMNQFVLLMMTLLFPGFVFAGAVITYHGRILTPAGRPIDSNNVTFRIRIFSPNPGRCLLYEEMRTISMVDSEGIFVIPIGDGYGERTPADPEIPMEKVFANDPNLTFNTTNTPKLTCNTGATYTPEVLHQRQLQVSFDDHSGAGLQQLPIMEVNFVPLAVSAYDAQNIGGTPYSSVLRVSGGAAAPLSPAYFTELMKLITGTSNQYEKAGQLRGSTVPVLANGQVLGWSGGAWSAITPMTSYTETDPSVKGFAKTDLPACGANNFLKDDGSGNLICSAVVGANGGTVSSVAAGAGLVHETSPGNPLTTSGALGLADSGVVAGEYSKVTVDAKGRVTGGTALTAADVPALDAAKITSGTISQNVNATTVAATNVNARNLRIYDGVSEYLTFNLPSGGTGYTLNWPNTAGSNGDVLRLNASGNLIWSPITSSGGTVTGVSSANADIAVASGTTTPVLTLNSGTGANQLLKLDGSGKVPAAILPASVLTTSGTFDGDIGGTSATTVVNKIKGTDIAISSLTGGNYLKYNGTNWVNATPSVADLSDGSSLIKSSQMPANCSAGQTLTFSSPTGTWVCSDIVVTASNFSSQTANTFLAAPTGSAGAPTFRTIAAADLPTGVATQWTTSGGNIYYNSGNIGIGTSTPAEQLTVAGMIYSTTGGIKFPDGTVQMTAGGNTGTNNSVFADIPDVIICGYSTIPADIFPLTLAYRYADGRTNYASPGYGNSHLLTLNADGSYNSSTGLTSSGPAPCINKSASQLYTAGQAFNYAKGPAAQWLQNGTSGYYNAGSVGIGTASPVGKLGVSGLGTLLHLSGNSSADITSDVYIARSSSGSAVGAGPNVRFDDGVTTNSNLIQNSQGNLAFWNYGSGSWNERMRITSAGTVGIGTNEPVSLLANTSTNLGDGGGTGIAPGGFSWQTNAGGYVANLFNSGTTTSAHGLQLHTSSTNAATYILNARSNGTDRFVVRGDGSVGIGTTAPSTKLEVAGDVKAEGFISTSDQRLKTSIEPIKGLEAVLQLNGYTYQWKKTGDHDAGVLAQEVEKVFPYAVRTDARTGYKGVKYQYLIAPLIEATKEVYGVCKQAESAAQNHSRSIASLENEVKDLRAENESLKKRLEKIEDLLEKMGSK